MTGDSVNAMQWNMHLLVNIYFDWNWFQKWLMARGWGEVLRVDRAYSKPDAVGLARWQPLAPLPLEVSAEAIRLKCGGFRVLIGKRG